MWRPEEAFNALQQKHGTLSLHYNNLSRMLFGVRSAKACTIVGQNTETGKVIIMFDAATYERLKEDYGGIIAKKEAEEKAIEEKYGTGFKKTKKKTVCKPTREKRVW